MKKFVLVLITFSFLCGCAFTGIGRNHTVGTIVEPNKNLNNEALTLHCAGTLYSFMLSPIIPLPPVIPAFGALGNGDAWITFNREFAKENNLTSFKIENSLGKVIYERQLDYNSDEMRYVTLPLKCEDLNNTVLYLNYSNTEKENQYSLIYKKGDIEWSWGYLGQ